MQDGSLVLTTRLYYTDSKLFDFTATVVERWDEGGRTLLVLDRTAFYPTTGGQPHDTGTLGGVPVVDVFDDEAGRVVHQVESGLEVGQEVRGVVDRARRLDHMQQHTGQHVLSAAFSRLYGVRTQSFHMGAAVSTIDLAREVTAEEIAAAEDEANRVVWDDRAVSIRFVTAEEAAALPLRKEPVRHGDLRLIDVEDFDLSACGGTHVARTGEIGIVVVRAWERFKGGSRLTFACGRRALASFRELRNAVTATTRQLSVLPGEVPAAVERALGESRDLRREMRGLAGQLAGYHARDAVEQAQRIAGVTLAAGARSDYDANGLKALAAAIVAEPGRAAVLFTDTRPALVVAACSADVTLDAAAIVRGLVAEFGGKGGGKPELAQGGGLDAESSVLVSRATAIVSGLLAR